MKYSTIWPGNMYEDQNQALSINTTNTETPLQRLFRGKDEAKIKEKDLLLKFVAMYLNGKLSFCWERFHLILKD